MIKELLERTKHLSDTDASNLANMMIGTGALTECSSVDEFMEMRSHHVDEKIINDTRDMLIDELATSGQMGTAEEHIKAVVNNLISGRGGAEDFYGFEFGVTFYLIGDGGGEIKSCYFAKCDRKKRAKLQLDDRDYVKRELSDAPNKIGSLPHLLAIMLIEKGYASYKIPLATTENSGKLAVMVRGAYIDDIERFHNHPDLHSVKKDCFGYFYTIRRLVHESKVTDNENN